MKRFPRRQCVVWLCNIIFLALCACTVCAQKLTTNALSLNGTDFVRANMQESGMFRTNDISIELWFKVEAPGALVGEADSLNEASWDYLLAAVLPDGSVVAGLPGISPVTVGAVNAGEWHHLLMSYDGANSVFVAMLDGGPVLTSAGIRQTPAASGRDANLTFGRGGPSNLGSGDWFSGQLDEVRIWNIPLDPWHIQNSWNRVIPAEAPGLVANWHFESASGSTSADSSGRNNYPLYVPLGTLLPLAPASFPLLPPFPMELNAATFSSDEAILHATLATNAFPISASFEWGAKTNYGNVTASELFAVGATNVSLNAVLKGLQPGIYHVRGLAVQNGTNLYTRDATFKLAAAASYAAQLHGADFIRANKQSTAMFDTDDFTFEFWFNMAAPGILLNEVDAADPTKWNYAFAEILPDGSLKTQIPGMAILEVGAVASNSWHHLAMTYSSADQSAATFLDGALVAEDFGGRFTPKSIGRTVNYAFGRGSATNLNGGTFFSGLLDEVRIWRRALSYEEIQSGYNKRIEHVDSALVAYWRFDEPAGVTPSDASGNGNFPVYSAPPLAVVDSDAPIVFDKRPVIGTLTVSNVNPEVARISGSIDTLGEQTSAYVEVSSSGGMQKVFDLNLTGSTNNFSFSQTTDLLKPGTTLIHVVASNQFGLVRGPDVPFEKAGWGGNALRIGSQDYLRTAAAQNTNFNDESITIELWLKPTTNGVLVSETTFPTTSTLDRSILEVNRAGEVLGGFDGVPTITLGTINLRVWNHVALRYNKATLSLDGFLNGNKSTNSVGDRVTPAEKGIQGYFAFARAARTPLAVGDAGFLGDLDEIRIWKRALADDEILSNRFVRISGSDTNLILYWNMDEVTPTSPIPDGSVRNNRGQNIGADVVASSVPLSSTFSPITVEKASATLSFLVEPFAKYRLDVSTDLTTWIPFSTNTAPGLGVLQVTAPLDGVVSDRFYRATPIP